MPRIASRPALGRAGSGLPPVAVLLCALSAPAAVPPPAETPVEVVVSGRTSTLKSIRIVGTGREIPPNFSGGRVRNTPGFRWYVSRHFALKTDMSEDWARQCLTWAELAWPHAVRVFGAEPEGLEARRMVFVYARSLGTLRAATWTDGGFRWQQPGGGVTFDFLRAAYNYPSGSLTYHKRDLVIHENLHLLQACLTGSCYNMPFRFLEGVTYAFASHVYDRRHKRLTVAVLDKPTVNNMYDAALEALSERFLTIADLMDREVPGPVAGLYTQFMWTDPDRLMKWRLWRDELLARRGGDLRAADRRLMREIYGDLDRLEAEWKQWVTRRRSTFHYVDWGWEQVGDTLWSYGWPQKTPFSQTNINLPLGEPARPDPLVMDYPAEPRPGHLVGPVRRGGPTPSVGALLDFSRNPDAGLCGLAFGVVERRRPLRLPAETPGQVNVYLREGRTLVLDGSDLGLGRTVAPLPDPVRAAFAAADHRAGLTVTVAPDRLRAVLKAGPPRAVRSCSAELALTGEARRRILARPSAVIARDGYHGVTPFFDAARRPPPDLLRPAPPNRWRFAGEEQTYGLYRAARRLGQKAPPELLRLRRRMADAMDADPNVQRAALAEYRAALPALVAALGRIEPPEPARSALADLLGLRLELRLAEAPSARRTDVLARVLGPAAAEASGRVTFRAGRSGPVGERPLAAAEDGTLAARWRDPLLKPPRPADLLARAVVRCCGTDVNLSARRTVYPSIPNWWVVGPFHNFGGGTSDTPHLPERRPVRLGESFRGKDGRTVRWQPCRRPDSLPASAEFLVDFRRLFGGYNVSAYAAAFLRCRRPVEAVLALGSDDGVVVWLNGRRIHRRLAVREYRPMADRVGIRLAAGVNVLLVKVTQGSGDWCFAAHLLDEAGRPAEGVEYLPGPPAEPPATRPVEPGPER